MLFCFTLLPPLKEIWKELMSWLGSHDVGLSEMNLNQTWSKIILPFSAEQIPLTSSCELQEYFKDFCCCSFLKGRLPRTVVLYPGYTLKTSGKLLQTPMPGLHPQKHQYFFKSSLGYSYIWPELLPTDLKVIRDYIPQVKHLPGISKLLVYENLPHWSN